jgi:hypothetical protein
MNQQSFAPQYCPRCGERVGIGTADPHLLACDGSIVVDDIEEKTVAGSIENKKRKEPS